MLFILVLKLFKETIQKNKKRVTQFLFMEFWSPTPLICHSITFFFFFF